MAAESKLLPRLVRDGVRLLPGESVAAARGRINAAKARRDNEQDRRERAEQEYRLLREQAKDAGWVHPRTKKKRKRIKVLAGGRPESNRRRH